MHFAVPVAGVDEGQTKQKQKFLFRGRVHGHHALQSSTVVCLFTNARDTSNGHQRPWNRN